LILKLLTLRHFRLLNRRQWHEFSWSAHVTSCMRHSNAVLSFLIISSLLVNLAQMFFYLNLNINHFADNIEIYCSQYVQPRRRCHWLELS
jgi:hypothetical protein